MSSYLSKSALKGLTRLGDLMIPRSGDLPSFSEYGGLEHVDDLLAYAPADDIQSLNSVLAILSYSPSFVLTWLVKKMETSHQAGNGAVATTFRQLDFGVKGIVLSCYYTEKAGSAYKGKTVMELIGCNLNRVE